MHPHPGGEDESQVVFPCVMFDGLYYVAIGYKQSWDDQQDTEKGLFKYSPEEWFGLIS
jgi:hypothetical protein